MYSLSDFRQTPNAIAADYSRSHVGSRIMLTGHITQASPDCSYEAHQQAWLSAAQLGEERWQQVFARADQVRHGFAGLMDSQADCIALGSSVHDLLLRFLSALPWQQRRKIVTTTGESPSVSRQLNRIAQLGFEVIQVPVEPATTVVERLSALIDEQTLAVVVSSVFRQNGHIAPELDTLLPLCKHHGAELFVNAHYSINVLSFSVRDYNLEQAFVVGNANNYCQMGDGLCFMHVPADCQLQPVITSWFGSFDPNVDNRAHSPDHWEAAHTRFDGSSVDPTSYFRACAVFDYFQRKGLTPDFLHDINHHQLRLIEQRFLRCDFDPDVIEISTSTEFLGGFMSFRSPWRKQIHQQLRDLGVHTDISGEYLRMGPAPYLADEQLEDAVHALEEVVRAIEP